MTDENNQTQPDELSIYNKSFSLTPAEINNSLIKSNTLIDRDRTFPVQVIRDGREIAETLTISLDYDPFIPTPIQFDIKVVQTRPYESARFTVTYSFEGKESLLSVWINQGSCLTIGNIIKNCDPLIKDIQILKVKSVRKHKVQVGPVEIKEG